MFVFVKLSGFN